MRDDVREGRFDVERAALAAFQAVLVALVVAHVAHEVTRWTNSVDRAKICGASLSNVATW